MTGGFGEAVEAMPACQGAAVMPVENHKLNAEAGRVFTTDLSAPILAPAELYGGKLVAAMDRQHPRDTFDVCGLYEYGGLTPEYRDFLW